MQKRSLSFICICIFYCLQGQEEDEEEMEDEEDSAEELEDETDDYESPSPDAESVEGEVCN